MNKKGNIPTFMLLIASVVLVTIALSTFASFKNDLKSNSGEFFETVNQVNFINEYVEKVFDDSVDKAIEESNGDDFNAEFRKNFERIVDEKNLKLKGSGNFFGKVRNGDYILDKDKIIVENVFVKSNVGNNEIIRNFNLERNFGSG